jgi:hypothetical protein
MIEITVYAKSIDKIHFYFECPFCWTKYKKNGEPYKNAKRLIHRHGSCNTFENREEHRVGHCRETHRHFIIVIDDNTFKNN